MEKHDEILAETSQILELSIDRLHHAPKDSQPSKDPLPPKYRDAVKQLTTDLHEERQRNGDLEATVSSLTQQLSEFESENSELQQRLDTMTKELEAVCITNSELERELFKKQRAHSKVEELQASLQEKEAAITEWHAHLKDLEVKFSKLEDENRALRSELHQTSSLHHTTDREIADFQRLIDSQSEEIKQLRSKLAPTHDENLIERMKSELVNSQEVRTRLAENNRRISMEFQQVKDENANLIRENRRLESELRTTSSKILHFEENIAELRKEREILTETIENLQNVSEKQSKELLETAIRDNSNPSPRLMEATSRLNEEMKKRLSDKAAFRALLQRDKDAFTAKIAEKDAVIASLREKMSWTPDIAYRTSEQLAALTAQLTQEREKRFSAERMASVMSTQDLRRELYERKVSYLI